MNRGYIIVDECGRNVVGYVGYNGTIKYIAHNNTDSCSINVITNKAELECKLNTLRELSEAMRDGHTFSYQEVK